MFSVTIQFSFIRNDWSEMQDLLPAAAFTALGWWFGSLDTKDLILNMSCSPRCGWIVQPLCDFPPRLPVNIQAVNIKSSRVIILYSCHKDHSTSACYSFPVLLISLGRRSVLGSWPDIKSGTQGCKICNISVPSACSVSTVQDREMSSLPRLWPQSLWQNTHKMCDWLCRGGQ